jgi:hypothetical protein
VGMVRDWQSALQRAIHIGIDEKHFPEGTDAKQVLFEIHGLILSLHHDARFLCNPGALERARQALQRIISHHATPTGQALMLGAKPASRASAVAEPG